MGIFGFEFGDPGLQVVDRPGEIGNIDLLRDVLRAICVPRFDSEQYRLLGLGAIVFWHQLSDDGKIVGHARTAPDLDATLVRIVHEEQERLVILGEVAGRDILAVAGIIGEGERVIVEHANESLGAAAMLSIGLASGV